MEEGIVQERECGNGVEGGVRKTMRETYNNRNRKKLVMEGRRNEMRVREK